MALLQIVFCGKLYFAHLYRVQRYKCSFKDAKGRFTLWVKCLHLECASHLFLLLSLELSHL